MQIRFSLGNIVGVVTTVAGYVVQHSDTLVSLSPYGKVLVAVGTVVLAVTKGFVSNNTAQIPQEKKVQMLPGVVFEKTGPLKP